MSTTGAQIAGVAGQGVPPAFNVWRVREDFPILRQLVHGKPLVYLDNSATTQKPRAVINAIVRFYTEDCANIHRAIHALSERATKAYEDARGIVRRFLNAAEDREVVFVRGTTEAINLVANGYGRRCVSRGDEILLSHMEHHSNIVPWQMLCEEKGARLKVAPIDDRGELVFEEFQKLLTARTKLVAIAHVSNALGTINPVKRIVEEAHRRGVPVLIDGAQAVAHCKVDVQELDCDFYCFSGHKVYGPNGIGALYGKARLLEEMPPYEGGGDMIKSVTFEQTIYNDVPHKFEAGTPNVSGTIALGAALEYLTGVGLENAAAHEHELLEYATEAVSEIPGVRLVGTAREKASVLSFLVDGVHPHDVATVLDRQGVAVRAGHVCAQPVMQRYGVPAITRASFAMYNTRGEVDALVAAIHKVKEIFG